MPPHIEIVRVALIVEVRLLPETLEEHVGYPPLHLGEVLASQVDASVNASGMGYYPPLKQLQGDPAIESDLLGLLEELAWHASEYARVEFRRHLRPAFSYLKIESVQSTSYTMPRARPGRANALIELARHYAPDSVRVELMTSSLTRDEGGDESHAAMVELTSQKVQRSLSQYFDQIEVCNARVVDPTS
ncbi:hypothetical protein BOW53_05220 [Solemya pervernicosa gill symbiont]|uniref:Uncharacterized protein n=2 Tax=Gammaproteobacteria incertae sedis TaxID=118884 RepID=A0A1T2L7P7_9GAMM|nr:hypothetical protein [Candidatus Reidiella endopervernicosa]OOZ41129.1 hypothetical protein BOW53_05220 [Solemya pervernicosa gill symbiont]QKQ26300.1 hypothetical protein HUE57_08385 [Candidatus Reidiella endopervernicosa]